MAAEPGQLPLLVLLWPLAQPESLLDLSVDLILQFRASEKSPLLLVVDLLHLFCDPGFGIRENSNCLRRDDVVYIGNETLMLLEGESMDSKHL